MSASISRRDALLHLSALLGAPLLIPSAAVRAEAPLENAFDELVKKFGFTADGPGLAVLVRDPRRILLRKCHGLASIKERKPITEHTMFELASVSKTFTAVATLILVDRGKLFVEDDVRKYVPELPEYDKKRPIRLLNLLQQTSGLPKDYMSFENVPARHKDYWVNDDYIGEFARQRKKFPRRFPADAKYEYNNSNYMILGTVIERVTKKTYAAFLREAIFEPAGMKNSFVYQSPDSVPRPAEAKYVRAIGYEKKRGQWQPNWGAPPVRHEQLLAVGDGGVWTNLEDLDAWDRTLRERKLLKPNTWRLALTPSHTRDGKVNDYGCGWIVDLGEKNQVEGFGHNGAWGGFRTYYFRHYANDYTLIILSNRGDFDGDKFAGRMDERIIKAKAR